MAFECGEREVFLQLWEEYIPSQVRKEDPTAQYLECNISAYFAVYPIRTGVSVHTLTLTHYTHSYTTLTRTDW